MNDIELSDGGTLSERVSEMIRDISCCIEGTLSKTPPNGSLREKTPFSGKGPRGALGCWLEDQGGVNVKDSSSVAVLTLQ